MVDFCSANQDLNKSFEQWIASEMLRGKKRKAPFEEYNDSPTASIKSLRLSNSERNIVNEQQNEEKDKYKNMLMVYKRIWENLDTSKSIDARLESFLWSKIREYNHMIRNSDT